MKAFDGEYLIGTIAAVFKRLYEREHQIVATEFLGLIKLNTRLAGMAGKLGVMTRNLP